MNRRRQFVTIMGGGGWQDVAVPDAAFSWLPFTIQKNGRNFRPSPTFNLQTYAGITPTTVKYVEKGIGTPVGNDANTGADWAHAYATIGKAFEMGADRVYVRNSMFYYFEIPDYPIKSTEIIATDNNVYFTGGLNDKVGAFTAVDNHYEGVFTGSSNVTSVIDLTNPNVDGAWWGTMLTLKTSVAEVDATPNSYYYVLAATATMYVHLSDGRAPDANVLFNSPYSLAYQNDNKTIYMYGVKNWATRFRNNSSAGGLKFYAENCEFGITLETAGADVILKDCYIYGGGDAHNIDVRNTVISHVVEINCNMQNYTNTSSAQASTSHNGCSVVRLSDGTIGAYHDVGGQVLADVINSKSWNLGLSLSNSRTDKIGFYTDSYAWLDCCTVSGCDIYDLQENGSGAIYVRDFVGEKGVNFGTVTPY